MESETRIERQRRQSRESHARWATRHPKRMKAARKAWARSESGRSSDASKKAVEKSRRAVLFAEMAKAGSYVIYRPDGSAVTVVRHGDGTWEIKR